MPSCPPHQHLLASFEGEKITIRAHSSRESCALSSVKFDARNHTEFIIWECAQESGTEVGKRRDECVWPIQVV